MSVTKMTCEWDIGINEQLWEREETARKDAAKALEDCGIEEPIDELEEAGLIYFETVEITRG